MPEEQLGFFGEATPLADLEGRTAPRGGGRGGSAKAAAVPDDHQRYYEMLTIFASHHWVLPNNVVRPDPPLADWQLAKRLPSIHPGTLSKRRLRLERAGLVEEVKGVMHTTPHGVEAMTFTITDKGREVLAQWQQRSSGSLPPTSESTSPSLTS